MKLSILVLLPPILMICFAFITRRIIPSFVVGIISAAIVATDFNILKAMHLIATRFWNQLEIDGLLRTTTHKAEIGSFEHLYVFTFLISLGIIITFISYTGGAQAYSSIIKKYIKKAKNSETMSVVLSILFSVDDYLSTLTVGSTMLPIADKFKIPRAKLAYLVDTMSAPLCILSPISSWCAMIVLQLKKSGINADITKAPSVFASPFTIYLKTIPYIFYSFIIFFGTLFIIRKNISFGLMKELETNPKSAMPSNHKDNHHHVKSKKNHYGSILNFIVPIFLFLGSIALLALYTGGWSILGGNQSLIKSIQFTDIYFAMFLGSIIAAALTTLYLLLRKEITFKDMIFVYYKGFMMMKDSIIILLLAWTLGTILKFDLNVGSFLSQVLIGATAAKFIPLMFFIIAFLIAFSIGTSWGTIALLTPMAIPIAMQISYANTPATIEFVPLLLPTLGALLSGAVAGDHVSPISDTTIISAACTGSHHFEHVYTQIEYAWPAVLSAGISFTLAGFFYQSTWIKGMFIPLVVGTIFYIASLAIRHHIHKKMKG